MEEQKETRKNPLGYEPIPRLLRRYAVPSIIAMVVSSLYNVVDQVFIGHKVGYLGNAATNVAFPITTITLAVALLTGVGGASNFGLNLGRKNYDEARSCVGNMVAMALALGIALCLVVQCCMTPMLRAFGATDTILPLAVSYVSITSFGIPFLVMTNSLASLIRTDGSPRYSMFCMVVGALINIVLDPALMYGFDMGVDGAALATTISQVISCVFSVAYLFRFRSVTLTKESFRNLSFRKCREIASLGTSVCLNQLALLLVQIVVNNSLAYYGALSKYGPDIPLSGAGIVMKVNSIVIGVLVGLNQGSQPILSFNYGARQYSRVRGCYRLALTAGYIMCVVTFLCFQLFPRPIISIFGTGNELYEEFTTRFLRTFMFGIILNANQMLSGSFFSAIGKPKKGVFVSLCRQVLFLIPIMLVMGRVCGLDGVMYSGPMCDILAFAVSVLMVRGEFRDMHRKEEALEAAAEGA